MAKQITSEQCNLLHQYWPNDCCLCNSKFENIRLKNRILELEEVLRQIRDNTICSGSGPIAPVFDEFDAEIERDRGNWVVIGGNIFEKVKEVLK